MSADIPLFSFHWRACAGGSSFRCRWEGRITKEGFCNPISSSVPPGDLVALDCKVILGAEEYDSLWAHADMRILKEELSSALLLALTGHPTQVTRWSPYGDRYNRGVVVQRDVDCFTFEFVTHRFKDGSEHTDLFQVPLTILQQLGTDVTEPLPPMPRRCPFPSGINYCTELVEA